MTADRMSDRPVAGQVDFTMMYVAHDAFTRDLGRMIDASTRGDALTPSVRAGWEMFTKQLHIHHTAEDVALWPMLRRTVAEPTDEVVLDEMEIEHAQLEPLLERVDKALASRDTTTLADTVRVLSTRLIGHMRHEEQAALPLVETYLGPSGWKAFAGHLRKTQGLRGAAEYLPWLLDHQPEASQSRVLGILPPPVRLLYRGVWTPRYRRTARW